MKLRKASRGSPALAVLRDMPPIPPVLSVPLLPGPSNFLKRWKKSTPNSSLLFSRNSPITVLRATCGALTSISFRSFCTFTTTSRLPRMMMVLARWSAMIFAFPIVTAFGVVSTACVESSSATFRPLPPVVEFDPKSLLVEALVLGMRRFRFCCC